MFKRQVKEKNPVEKPEQDELEITGKSLQRGVPWKSQTGDISRRRNWSSLPNGLRKGM